MWQYSLFRIACEWGDVYNCDWKLKYFKESVIMTENEKVLIETIRNQADPTQAMITAMGIISDYLTQPESFE